jgi:hypothetical protein
MSLFGSPTEPRCPLGRLRPPTTQHELEAMRARAWHEHGVAALSVGDIANVWLRQAITNEATRRWGPRNGEHNHGQ